MSARPRDPATWAALAACFLGGGGASLTALLVGGGAAPRLWCEPWYQALIVIAVAATLVGAYLTLSLFAPVPLPPTIAERVHQRRQAGSERSRRTVKELLAELRSEGRAITRADSLMDEPLWVAFASDFIKSALGQSEQHLFDDVVFPDGRDEWLDIAEAINHLDRLIERLHTLPVEEKFDPDIWRSLWETYK